MAETFGSINAWQREIFPDATVDGVLRHINQEWREFSDATGPAKVIEAVDLILLLVCFIDRETGAGAQPSVDAKMAIVRGREWDIQPDGTGRHK